MKLHFCRLDQYKTYEGHSSFKEIVVIPPTCNCFTESTKLDYDTQTPALEIKNECLWNEIREKKALHRGISRIWVWMSFDRWLDFYANLARSYYLRKSLGLEDLHIDFTSHADTIYYLDLLCAEWESNVDLKAYYLEKIPSLGINDEKIMELNPIYKYNIQTVPLQKCVNNLNEDDAMQSLKFLPYSNNMYPCLVGYHAAVDYYVRESNVKTYDEYISCMQKAYENRCTSWFKEDLKLFKDIKVATITDVIVSKSVDMNQVFKGEVQSPEKGILACCTASSKTGLFKRGFPLNTVLFLIRDAIVEKTYIEIVRRFVELPEDTKRLIIFNLMVIDAVYVENGVQFYFSLTNAIKKVFFNAKDERVERILELKNTLYEVYSLSPEYSKFQDFSSTCLNDEDFFIKTIIGFCKINESLMSRIKHTLKSHIKRLNGNII